MVVVDRLRVKVLVCFLFFLTFISPLWQLLAEL